MENNKDILSQEEIDALLKGSDDDSGGDDGGDAGNGSGGGTGSGGDGNGGNGNNSLSDVEKDAIGEIGNITMGTAATTLSVLLNSKVSITTPRVSITDYSTLRKEFPKPHVAVEVEYLEGLEGINVLILKQEDAKMIADLMMGGDGTNIDYEAEIEEFHLSAVGEAMNQMMGSASTSMSDMLGESINISPPSVKMLDLNSEEANEELPEEPMIKVAFDLKIGNLIDSEIMQLIPLDFSKNMVSSLTSGAGEEQAQQEAPQQAEEPQPSAQQQTTQPEQPPQQMQQQPPQQQAPQQPPQQQQPAANMGAQQGAQQPQKDYQPVEFSSLEGQQQPGGGESSNIELIMDVPLEVTVELGQTKKKIQEILELVPGSIVELDKVAGEPVDIKVNGKLIAKGEVVVIDENFGIRITEIISPVERINKLQ